MFKVWTRTLSCTIIQVLTYILSTCTQIILIWFIYKTGVQLASKSIPNAHIIIGPGLLMIGLGIGVLFHRLVFIPIIFIESLSHVIAITSVVTGLPQELPGSRTLYSFSQMRKYFFGLTASTVITKTTLKLFTKFKDIILEKDIIPHFQQAKHPIIKFVSKICINSIKSLLDLIDELLVSYVWLGTYLYVEYSDNPKTGSKEIIKQQARYILECIALFVKVFPSLLANNFAYDILFHIIATVLTIGTFVVLYHLIGFSFWIFIILFLFYRLVKDIIYNSIIYNLRCCSVVTTFYVALDKLRIDNNMPSAEILHDLVSKIPSLIPIAKKTKDDIFNDLISQKSNDAQSEENGGIVDFNPLEDVLKKYVNDVAKCFMISEHDILKTSKENEVLETETEEKPQIANATDLSKEHIEEANIQSNQEQRIVPINSVRLTNEEVMSPFVTDEDDYNDDNFDELFK